MDEDTHTHSKTCSFVAGLTWKLEICSRSSGLVTDNCPVIGSMMKRPVGVWSAPGPVTL